MSIARKIRNTNLVMRFKLTKYGWPQTALFLAIVLPAMIVCLLVGVRVLPLWAVYSIEAILAIVLIYTLAFFRDPDRAVPADKNILLSPADGKITDIETIQENDFIGGGALRIGIFLSIFDVHINRAPCNVKVERITYKKGKYKNAANPQSGRVNESNDLGLVRTDKPQDRLVVRQISGAIARRIVCETRQGQKLAGGQKFGMIKFGSRTELYVPARVSRAPSDEIQATRYEIKCLVKIGDKVKAGLTPLVKYELRIPNNEY